MFLLLNNGYIIRHFIQEYEGCKISQNTGRGESIGKVTKDNRDRKRLSYEGIIDEVGSVWIRTQTASQGSQEGTGRKKECQKQGR